ncbi:hypothetical protein [Sulfuritalea sp.]|uniref:hypothetical protein n=1 Tax=Sulfuritalea sp. TaxID=2480090 RepID=UPI00286DC078|nr:hypothetical protein [Sulfuritalea sp.]
MKVKTIVAVSLFTAIAALSGAGFAASDTDKAAEVKAPAANEQTGKKVKPHSHMEEKTGMPQKVADSKAAKPDPAKDKSKHFHPRDGK